MTNIGPGVGVLCILVIGWEGVRLEMGGGRKCSPTSHREVGLFIIYTYRLILRTGKNFTAPQEFVCPYMLCFPEILLNQGSDMFQEADVL